MCFGLACELSYPSHVVLSRWAHESKIERPLSAEFGNSTGASTSFLVWDRRAQRHYLNLALPSKIYAEHLVNCLKTYFVVSKAVRATS